MAREVTSDDLNQQQKARGQRIDKLYYKKPHPWRRFMLTLTWILPIVAGVVLGFYAMRPSGAAIYMPGPVSTKHSMFADRCDACHDQTTDPKTGAQAFGAVTDAKCKSCHDGPLHVANQKFPHNVSEWDFAYKEIVNGKEVIKTKKVTTGNPTCASCHTEHKGSSHLTSLNDRHCTQCHANLEVADGSKLRVQSSITSFGGNHPEWAVLKAGAKDPTPFKFNHKVHFKVKNKEGRTLGCNDCHMPDNQRAYMEPINYAKHCQECHPAGTVTDVPILGNLELPHSNPELVRAYVKTALTDKFIKAGSKVPPKLTENPKYVKPKPGRPKPKEPEFIEEPDPRTPDQWLTEMTDKALAGNFFPTDKQMGSSCLYCHVSNGKDDATNLPKIADPKIPAVWLPKSIFDHEVHRVVNCNECHKGALTSESTADLMLPGVKSCQDCHKVEGGARSGCVECHVYHDKTRAGHISTLTMDDLLKGISAKKPPVTQDGTVQPAGEKKEEPKAEEPKADAPKAEETKAEEKKPEEKKAEEPKAEEKK